MKYYKCGKDHWWFCDDTKTLRQGHVCRKPVRTSRCASLLTYQGNSISSRTKCDQLDLDQLALLRELADRGSLTAVAEAVGRWNAAGIGSCGLGDVGAVVGATHPAELRELREALPAVWFLVPGYGAQGGTAADVKEAYRADGLGAVVNSSRGVTFPFHPDDPGWEAKVVEAAKKAAAELAG